MTIALFAVAGAGMAGKATASGPCSSTVSGNTKLSLTAPVKVSQAPADVHAVDLSCEVTFAVLTGSGGSKACWGWSQPKQLAGGAVNAPFTVEIMYNSTNFKPTDYTCHLRRKLQTVVEDVDPASMSPGDVVVRMGTIGGPPMRALPQRLKAIPR
jgi:hypothetical protein